MTKFSKIILTLSAIAFVASLTDAGSNIAYGFLKPLGAVLFIVFFIAQLLEKEVASYDAEECQRMAQARPASAASLSPEAHDQHAGLAKAA